MKKIVIACLLIFSAALLAIWFYVLQQADESAISCRSEFNSKVDDSRLHADVKILLSHGKGSIMIIGDYWKDGSRSPPIKILTGFDYQTSDGEKFYIKVRNQHSTLTENADRIRLYHLLPLVLSSTDIEYAYTFKRDSTGDYLITQNNTPVLYCEKSRG